MAPQIADRCLVEFGVEDADRSLEFYGNVFGWASFPVEGPIEYHIAGEIEQEAVGAIMPSAHAPHTLVTFCGAETDEEFDLSRLTKRGEVMVQRIKKSGGRVI